MIDIFFSYSSEDRDHVRPVHNAIEELGFDVFWDQEVPAGTDWDSWIKFHLKSARSAIVFWSTSSIASRNVRQEATIAHDEGKLIQILLTPLGPEQFPMGLYTTQAIDLSGWQGSPNHEGWLKLRRELEIKVSSKWVSRKLLSLETLIKTERMKREMAEAREAVLEAKFADEVTSQKAMRLERDEARAVAETATAQVESLQDSKRLAKEVLPDTERRLKDAVTAKEQLEAALRDRPAQMPRWAIWTGLTALVAALILGFWTAHTMSVREIAGSGQAVTKEQERRRAAETRVGELERDNKQLQADLLTVKGRQKSAETRIGDLERESLKLEKDLQIARGIVEADWIEAAIALKAAKDKLNAERAKGGAVGSIENQNPGQEPKADRAPARAPRSADPPKP